MYKLQELNYTKNEQHVTLLTSVPEHAKRAHSEYEQQIRPNPKALR